MQYYPGIFQYFLIYSVHARYHFECACTACTGDWQKTSSLPKNVKGLSHNAYKDKTSINKLQPLLKAKDKKLKNDEVSNLEKLKICIDCMKLAESILNRPHALLCELENDLHRQLYVFYSNTWFSQWYLRLILDIFANQTNTK